MMISCRTAGIVVKNAKMNATVTVTMTATRGGVKVRSFDVPAAMAMMSSSVVWLRKVSTWATATLAPARALLRRCLVRKRTLMVTEPRVGGVTRVAKDAAHCVRNVFQNDKRSGTTPMSVIAEAT